MEEARQGGGEHRLRLAQTTNDVGGGDRAAPPTSSSGAGLRARPEKPAEALLAARRDDACMTGADIAGRGGGGAQARERGRLTCGEATPLPCFFARCEWRAEAMGPRKGRGTREREISWPGFLID